VASNVDARDPVLLNCARSGSVGVSIRVALRAALLNPRAALRVVGDLTESARVCQCSARGMRPVDRGLIGGRHPLLPLRREHLGSTTQQE